MTRFFDSSAIVPAYGQEAGTLLTRRRLTEGVTVVSRLAEVEVASALARLAREVSLPAGRLDAAISSFLADLADWHVVEVNEDVTKRARELLVVHPLRASDAIQLSSALTFESRLGSPVEFVSHDRRLLAAARAERLNVPLE